MAAYGEEVFKKTLLLTFLSLIEEEVVEIQSYHWILYPKLERKNCTIKEYLCDRVFLYKDAKTHSLHKQEDNTLVNKMLNIYKRR